MGEKSARREAGGATRGSTGAGCLLTLGVFFLLGYFLVKKMEEATRPSNVKATPGNLGHLRSSLSIYYGDLEGLYPQGLSELMVQRKYLDKIPTVKTMDHPDNDEVVFFSSHSPMDSGAWGYVNNPYSDDWGLLFVDCTHTDFKGTPWFKF